LASREFNPSNSSLLLEEGSWWVPSDRGLRLNFSAAVGGVVGSTSSVNVPLSWSLLIRPVPVLLEITLWSDDLLGLVNHGNLMVITSSDRVDTSSLNLMLSIWNDGSGLPDWIVNG